MSRYGEPIGVYIPTIRSSREVEDIVDILALAVVRAMKELSKVVFVEMYTQEVSRNGYDNEMFDEVVQFLANVVDAEGVANDDDSIDGLAEQVVLGMSAVFVANNRRLEDLLLPEELTVLDDCAAEMKHMVQQLERPARQSRGGSRRGGRDSRRPVDRRDYNGGRDSYDDRSQGRRSNSQSPRSRRQERDPYNYRGNTVSDGRVSNRNGRQPPAAFESYHDTDGGSRDHHDNLTTKERLRQEHRSGSRQSRQATTTTEPRGGRKVPVGGHYTVEEVKPSQARPEARAARNVTPVKDVTSGEEVWHEKKDGSRVVVVPVSMREIRQRKGPYQVIPLFPTNTDGYFTLNSSGDITGVVGLPKSEEDMDIKRHDTTRFFTAWGPKTRDANALATAKALGNIQVKARIDEIEKELEEKYNFDDLEELPVIDMDKMYVVNTVTTYEPHEDFVSTGRQLLIGEVSHEHVKDMFEEGASTATINYSAVEFCGWTITGDAAKKAMELRGLTSFSAIKNKLFELEALLPSSVLHELDVIATRWVNEFVQYNLGIDGWIIDSFMLDIETLITELAKEYNITIEFTSMAPKLVGSVLCPLTNKDADIRELTGLSEDGPFSVKFGKLTNITLIQIDSDELALHLDGLSGTVTRESWPTLAMALDVINTLSKPTTASSVMITRDNRKIHISQGKNPGEYILSR